MLRQSDRTQSLSIGGTPHRVLVTLLTVVVLVTLVGTPISADVAGTTAEESTDDAKKVDVVFVFDRSASTNENRYHIARQIESLDEGLETNGVDARYGLVTYNGSVRTEQSLTADFGAFQRAMHFSEAGNEEHASDALLAATDMSFRDDAEPVVVLVTDEDDDASNATRADALSAVANVTFVAVSPASPHTSSCSAHSPPCDDRTDNELRTMSESVDGYWFDIHQNAEPIVDQIETSIELAVDIDKSDAGPTGALAEFERTDQSVNRTTVETGEMVEFTETVENTGAVNGTYETYLSHEGTILAETSVDIPAGESRTVRFGHAFDTPGDYTMRISHEAMSSVTVVPPHDTTVETEQRQDGTAVVATITDARANGSVSVPLADTALATTNAGAFVNATVSIGDVDVTPRHDVAFDVEIATAQSPPDGVDSLPDDVNQSTYLTVNSSLGPGYAGVAFDYVTATNDTTLYRYDETASAWRRVDRTAVSVDEDGTHWRSAATNSTTFAIGVGPSQATTDDDSRRNSFFEADGISTMLLWALPFALGALLVVAVFRRGQ